MVNRRDRLEAYLAPLMSGTGRAAVLPETTLRSYIAYLELLIRAESVQSMASFDDDEVRWIQQVSSMSHRRRAYGGEKVLNDWYQARGWRCLRSPST